MLTPQAGVQVDKFYAPVDWQYSFPEGYTRLEYIQSSGTQYIDTNVQSSSDLIVDTEYYYESGYFFGYSGTIDGVNKSYGYPSSVSGSYLRIGGGYVYNNSEWGTNKWLNLHIENSRNNVTLNGVTFSNTGGSFGTHTFSNGGNITLGRYANTNFVGKVKYFRIKQGNNLLRNLIPVKRNSDGVLGMLDLANVDASGNYVFYPNVGTGEFVMGPELYSNNSQIDIRQKNNTNFVEKYKFNANNELIWANPQLNLSGKINYEKIGNAIIDDGIASNFSNNNYISIKASWLETYTDYEIVIRAKPSPTTTSRKMILCQGTGNNSQLKLFFRTNLIQLVPTSDSYRFSVVPSITLNADTFYYIKLRRQGNKATLAWSTDNITYNDSTSQDMNWNTATQFLRLGGGSSYWGSAVYDNVIDLKETYIKVNNKLWFYGKNYTSENYAPVPAGLNCKIKGPISYTEIGTLTNNDGVYSGFSDNNYLNLTNSQQITSITDFELNIKITTNSIGTKQGVCGIGAGQAGIYIANNGRLHIVALDCTNNKYRDIDMSINLSANTTYYIKNIFRNGNVYGSYSIDGINYTIIQGATATGGMGSVTTLSDYKFGYNSQGSFDGSIDLNNTYIKINNQLWFGFQQVIPSIGYVNTQTQEFIPAPTDGIKYSQTRDLKVIPPEDNTITLLYGTDPVHHLPSEYEELAAIQSSGTQWIDTGYIPNGQETSYNIKIGITQINTDTIIFGDRENNSNALYLNQTNRNMSYVNISNRNYFISDSSISINDIYNFTIVSTYNSSNTIKLFCRNDGQSLWKGIIYNFYIKQGSTLIHHYIPARRKSDSAVGMYDLVEGEFLENQGTGTFTAVELKYKLFGLLASVSSGTYDVYIDDVLYATTASATQTDIDFSALGAEYVPIGTCTTPEELVLHKIVIKPTTSGETIIAFRTSRHSTQTGSNNIVNILWGHLQLDNILSYCRFALYNNSYCSNLYAITAKNNLLSLNTCDNILGQNYDLNNKKSIKTEYIPNIVLNASGNNLGGAFNTSGKLKRVNLKIPKNITTGDSSYAFQGSNIEQVNIDGIVNITSRTINQTVLCNTYKLKLIPNINISNISTSNPYISNAKELYPSIIKCDSDNTVIFRTPGTSTYPMRGLRGLKVSNEAPFSGTSPQINVSYTGLDRDALVELFESMPGYMKLDKVGEPTIDSNGVVSGFSDNDYLKRIMNNIFDDVKSIMFTVKINSVPTTITNNALVLGLNGLHNIRFYVNPSKNLVLSFFDINNTQRYLSANTIKTGYYRFILEDNINPKVYYSDDNITWNLVNSTSYKPNVMSITTLYMGYLNSTYNVYDGSIDLKNSYITINNARYQFQLPDDTTTRAINITAATGNNLTKVGTGMTIDNNGVASGFSSSNYIKTLNSINLSNYDSFEFTTKFIMGVTGTYTAMLTHGAISIFTGGGTSTIFVQIVSSANRYQISYTANSEKIIKILYKNSKWYIYVNDSLVKTYKNIAVPSINTAVGYGNNYNGSATGFNGSIDLENTYIKVGQNYLMKGYLTDNDRLIATNKGWGITG